MSRAWRFGTRPIIAAASTMFEAPDVIFFPLVGSPVPMSYRGAVLVVSYLAYPSLNLARAHPLNQDIISKPTHFGDRLYLVPMMWIS